MTMWAIMAEEENPVAVRLNAARMILTSKIELQSHAELAKQIADLEAQFAQRKPNRRRQDHGKP
jgi:hypothetical protein